MGSPLRGHIALKGNLHENLGTLLTQNEGPRPLVEPGAAQQLPDSLQKSLHDIQSSLSIGIPPHHSHNPNHPHHHHHHGHLNEAAVVHEMQLYLIYLAIFVALEFMLIYFNFLNTWTDDFVFLLIIVMSLYSDLNYESQTEKLHALQAKISFVKKLISYLAIALIFFGCFTNEFTLDTLEIEVTGDDGNHGVVEETLVVWKWVYRGYNKVENSSLSSTSNGTPLKTLDGLTTEEDLGKQNIEDLNVGAGAGAGSYFTAYSVLKLFIHVVVCATKFAVIRFMFLEWEHTIKLVVTYFQQ